MKSLIISITREEKSVYYKASRFRHFLVFTTFHQKENFFERLFFNDFDRLQRFFCKVLEKSRIKDFVAKISPLQQLKTLIKFLGIFSTPV